MKKILLLLFAIITTNSFSQNIDDKINNNSDKKKFFNGYDGLSLCLCGENQPKTKRLAFGYNEILVIHIST